MDDRERLAAEWECEKLVRSFALLNDARDDAALADLFTPDGLFQRGADPGAAVRGRVALRAYFAGRPPDRFTRHFCANTVITCEGFEAARGVTYVLLYTGDGPASGSAPRKAAPQQLVGIYRDRFHRLAEGWRIAERTVAIDLAT